MAKKNRTGLQSEVSHIFAGVPLPKKKRPRPSQSEKKPESEETTKTPAEQLPVEETPVQEPLEKQSTPAETSVEQAPVTESLTDESPATQQPAEQEHIKETMAEQSVTQSKIDQPLTEIPVEHLMAPRPIIKEPAVEQPIIPEPSAEKPTFEGAPIVELPVEVPSAPFGQAIELPDIEEPDEALQEVPSVRPIKTSIPEKSVTKSPRKVSTRPKDKRITSKSRTSSRKQTTKVILLISLLILLFFLLVKPPFGKSSKNNTASDLLVPPTSQLSSKPNAGSIVIDWLRPEEYPAEIRDPMLLSSQQQFYSKTWKPPLIGITYTEKQKYAIIGEELLEEGNEINGVKIIKINRDSVEFERDGQKWTQEVQSENN